MGFNKNAKDFLYKTGWAVFFILILVLAFYALSKDSAPEKDKFNLNFICNHLIVSGPAKYEVYPFLNTMGDGLLKINGASEVIYSKNGEPKSDKQLMDDKGLVICSAPTDLCFAEMAKQSLFEEITTFPNFEGGSYCFSMRLEVPVFYSEWRLWYGGIK